MSERAVPEISPSAGFPNPAVTLVREPETLPMQGRQREHR